MSKFLRPLAAVVIAAAMSGCGSKAPAADGRGDAGTTAVRTEAVKFSQCMRANGVAAFPDPDASGQLTIDQVANGSSIDVNSAAFTHALTACKSLEPSGFTGQTRSSQQQEAALKFAQCIRRNGVPDFPDPAPGAPLVDTNRIPSAAGSAGMSALRAAMAKCNGFIASQLSGK